MTITSVLSVLKNIKGHLFVRLDIQGSENRQAGDTLHTFQFNQRPHAFQLKSFAVIIPLHPADIPLVSIDQ